jgi:DNA-binding GntR family transcriptional regulator
MDDDSALTVDRTVKSLRERTLDKLRDAILNLRFKPGERLVEHQLCDQLGVSRTVVREVLRHLEAEGLVKTLARQGPVVARPDPDSVAEIYELRGLLEALAAQACAERASDRDAAQLGEALDRIEAAYRRNDPIAVLKATTEFYAVLFMSSGKVVAWEVVQSLNARVNFLRAMTISTPGRDKSGIAEMRRIVDAITARKPDEAYAATIDHVRAAAALATRYLWSQTDAVAPAVAKT